VCARTPRKQCAQALCVCVLEREKGECVRERQHRKRETVRMCVCVCMFVYVCVRERGIVSERMFVCEKKRDKDEAVRAQG